MDLRKIFFIAACAASVLASAQSECSDYWTGAQRSSDARFRTNGQSRGASVQVGKPTELNIIVYKGQDYHIAFAYDEKVLGDSIHVRLIEKVREANIKPSTDGSPSSITYADVRKVIWDNAEQGGSQDIEFTATSSKRMAIEVTAPGVSENGGNGKRSDRDIGCLGILIEHMPTPNVGF